MSINKKVIIFFILQLLFFSVTIFVLQYLLVYPSFKELEEIEANTNIERIEHAIDKHIVQTDTAASKWAYDSLLHDAIVKEDKEDLKAHFSDEILDIRDINVIQVYDNNGKLLFYKNRSIAYDNVPKLSQMSRGNLYLDEKYRSSDKKIVNISGLYMGGTYPVFISIRPIVYKKDTKSPYGTLIIARKLDSERLMEIEHQASVVFKIYPVDFMSSGFKNIAKKIIQTKEHYHNDELKDYLLSYQLRDAIDIKNNLLIEVKQDRHIVESGLSAIKVVSIAIAIFGIIVLMTSMKMMHSIVVAPIMGLSRHMHKLMENAQDADANFINDLSRTDDEIGHLASEFKQMHAVLKKKNASVEELLGHTEHANVELNSMATFDTVTKVHNRRYFDEELHKEWRRLRRSSLPMTLMLIDIDYFDAYNKSYGKKISEYTMMNIAQEIKSKMRRSPDIIARYEGDSFAIILPETSIASAKNLATMLLEAVENLKIDNAPSKVSPYVTISIGITSAIPEKHFSIDKLMDDAVKALDEAKRTGRNRFAMTAQY